jgi:hypothetical protein
MLLHMADMLGLGVGEVQRQLPKRIGTNLTVKGEGKLCKKGRERMVPTERPERHKEQTELHMLHSRK